MNQPMQVLTSHKEVNWLTPPDLIAEIKKVLIWIDLDPASHPVSQDWISAKETFNENGQNQKWFGNVFCNPPYGIGEKGSNQALWSSTMAGKYETGEFEQGILLINSTHGYKWYEELWSDYPVCCLRERVTFLKPDKSNTGPAKRGQTLVYFGMNVKRFNDVFSPLGRVLFP